MIIEIPTVSTAVWGSFMTVAAVCAVVWNWATHEGKSHKGFVEKEHCHSAMDEIKKEVGYLRDDFKDTNTKIDELAGFVKGLTK
jgi:hypothetical protein